MNNHASVMVHRNVPPMIIEKSLLEMLKNWSQERENKTGNLITVGSIKREIWFGPNRNPVLPESRKLPLLTTTVHALNHWFTDKIITLMNPD